MIPTVRRANSRPGTVCPVVDPQRRRTALILDLDGTLYRGDGPVEYYAATVASSLRPEDGARLRELVAAFLGRGPAADPLLHDACDGWQAVAVVADALGVDPDVRHAAYLTSRAALGRGEIPVAVPGALRTVLPRLTRTTYVVLVSNSPDGGLADLLNRLHVADLLDEVVPDAHKPEGMPAILARAAESVGATEKPWRVGSAGDFWRNDLAPAIDFGATTFYVDRFGRGDGEGDTYGGTIEDVLPAILSWCAEPDAFHSPPDPDGPAFEAPARLDSLRYADLDPPDAREDSAPAPTHSPPRRHR